MTTRKPGDLPRPFAAPADGLSLDAGVSVVQNASAEKRLREPLVSLAFAPATRAPPFMGGDIPRSVWI